MNDSCKYCHKPLEDLTNEGLQCESCENYVHFTCLRRGSTPGAFAGDVFFVFTCAECSESDSETFLRDNPRWIYIVILAFYHLNLHNKALSRKGFYHWRLHVAMFIDKHWSLFFPKVQQRKNWMGTISGILSVNSSTFFTKCTNTSEQGWWTLTYPKLTPHVQVKLLNDLNATKATLKAQNQFKADAVILSDIVHAKKYAEEFTFMSITTQTIDFKIEEIDTSEYTAPELLHNFDNKVKPVNQKRSFLPTFGVTMVANSLNSDCLNGTPPRKKQKLDLQWDETPSSSSSSQESFDSKESKNNTNITTTKDSNIIKDTENVSDKTPLKLLDPMCHYNTSLNNLFMLKKMNLMTKLMGGLREETILSPYSNLYLKPYIHRDVQRTPLWLQIMAQIQLKVNEKVKDYVLPSRASVDYVYVQPSHIPAINSLCNQFFWPGIDLTECLQYPDFSCVVMYKKLIVGFAFIVPDVKVHENYMSFIFVRPGWRNIGIGKFMVYHLIQTSMGKDITLHVAINNPGLFLYQKFGFKVEHVELNFYEKYLRSDSFESKHAFFCRLER